MMAYGRHIGKQLFWQ